MSSGGLEAGSGMVHKSAELSFKVRVYRLEREKFRKYDEVIFAMAFASGRTNMLAYLQWLSQVVGQICLHICNGFREAKDYAKQKTTSCILKYDEVIFPMAFAKQKTMGTLKIKQ